MKDIEIENVRRLKVDSLFIVNLSPGKVEAFKKVKESFLIFKVEFRLVAQSYRIYCFVLHKGYIYLVFIFFIMLCVYQNIKDIYYHIEKDILYILCSLV